MNTFDLTSLLAGNPYPGRGIILGMTEDGTHAFIAYFIMGRSENSRNRVFVPTDDGIITKAFDESKMIDPSLIIYAPVRRLADGTLIVTNGDQTDTIRDAMNLGGSFESALRTRTFEPDAPNFTPRISGLVKVKDGRLRYQLSILKSGDDKGSVTRRFFFDYEGQPGLAHFIHTYQGDGNPLPSFEGEPEQVALKGDPDQLTETIWHALNADNRISLYTSTIRLSDGVQTTHIINKLENE